MQEFYTNLTTPDPNGLQIPKSINVRIITPNEIQDYARKKARSTYFPSLITLLCLRAQPNESNEPESGESSTKSKLKADSTNATEEAKTEEEPNSPKPRVDPNDAEPVEPSVNPELTIPIPTSSNAMIKSKFSTMMDMWKFIHNQQQPY
ncbi:hypothetical protein PVK06_043424 [Gossypium arboreum]|uniref:Uncharacterized protein n=1 Tax=Gossypium arboreum TaxID=29729 RepID=A0ABR0MNT7_GOSAR|nr:hypothetical protein PVK06_043424 [Gossypium arboreum]